MANLGKPPRGRGEAEMGDGDEGGRRRPMVTGCWPKAECVRHRAQHAWLGVFWGCRSGPDVGSSLLPSLLEKDAEGETGNKSRIIGGYSREDCK